MSKLAAAVKRLHELILEGGDFHTQLVEINQRYGAKAVPELLRLPDLPPVKGHAHYAIVHTVEALDCAEYVQTLRAEAAAMSGTCPERPRFLIGRVITSDETYKELCQQLRAAKEGKSPAIAAAVERLRQEAVDQKLKDYVAKCDALLAIK